MFTSNKGAGQSITLPTMPLCPIDTVVPPLQHMKRCVGVCVCVCVHVFSR